MSTRRVVPEPGTQPSSGGRAARISGRVCVLADPQILDACSIKGAGGLSVNMGAATATTTADGSFTIEPDATTNIATTPISVTGAGVVASQTSVRGSNIVPVMTKDLFDQMALATGITTETDSGAIMATVDTATVFRHAASPRRRIRRSRPVHSSTRRAARHLGRSTRPVHAASRSSRTCRRSDRPT